MKKLDSSQAIYKALKDNNINFIVSVPCINLAKVLEMIEHDEEIKHIPATREEEGFGIAAGAYMAGENTAILMQNSGLGNSINVIASLYKLYRIPILMIISHRGTRGEFITAQVPMGEATPLILEALNIPYHVPSTPEEAYNDIKSAWKLAKAKKHPTAILLKVSFW
ncbi:MAG: sulfopyruvate decarboxylase subunit alpha [Methanobacteriaceae archaeon]|nr:sulfopyruvate decarboxylase subunit alpha [Methanobacteriaceae archaeon]